MQTAQMIVDGPNSETDPHEMMNVLILDDVQTDRVRIRRFLRKAGLEFNLFEAEDLASFRDQLDSAKMDLVFLDYYLDIDTGLDALKLLSAHEEQVGALPIMVTSLDRVDIAVEAMRGGCADYLIKEELSVEAIRKSVTSAFERRILVSALSGAQTSRHAIHSTVTRFTRTCGPEIRAVLAATLRHVRAARGSVEPDSFFASNLHRLEVSCKDIYGFFDYLGELVGELEAKTDERSELLDYRPPGLVS